MLLNEGQEIQSPDVLPNGFGGEPFPAKTTITHLTGVDEAGCEVNLISTTPDPEETTRIVSETIGEVFDVDSQQPQETFDIQTPPSSSSMTAQTRCGGSPLNKS